MISLLDLVAYSLFLPIVVAFIFVCLINNKPTGYKLLSGLCIIGVGEFLISVIWALVVFWGERA
jgi:hypothetical protein